MSAPDILVRTGYSGSLSTLTNTADPAVRQMAENLRTDSTYMQNRAFASAAELKVITRFGTVRRKLTTVRSFDPWVVNLIARRSLNDMTGEHVPVFLYAKSGQPAHAATVASKLWKLVARRGCSSMDPWPDDDSEAISQRIDDADFATVQKEAMNPVREKRCLFFGHPLSPWAFIVGDQAMADSLLVDLKSRGPTLGGMIPEDLPPELGGRGMEMEADLHPEVEDTH